MDDQYQFAVTVVPNPTFSDDELIRIGVAFIDNIESQTIKLAASELGIKIDNSSNLMDNGLTLTQLGSIEHPQWALHKSKLTPSHVDGIWRNEGFYDISIIEKRKGGYVPIFEKVYLREDHMEEDVGYYIEIHLKSLQAFHVHSEIVQ